MTREWDESDDDGKPPRFLVGFTQWTFADKLVSDLREQIGETVTEEELVAYVSDRRNYREVAKTVLVSVRERHPEWVRSQQDYRTGFERRLRQAFGQGFDWLEAFIDLCAEVAHGIHDRGEVDQTGEVLLDLHARACLAAKEVHALLCSGFPNGALAAWRTIHEAAVYASLLGEHGHEDDDRLTRRWFAFIEVERYRDAKVYQDRAAQIDHEPFPDDVMTKMEASSKVAIDEWDRSLKDPNGWAAELTAPSPPQFIRLEELAGLGHLRGHYRWASHRVHADGRGNETNLYRRGEQIVRLVGPTNTGGFVDAADLAIGSLHVTTNALLMRSRADEAHLGEIVVGDLLGLLRNEIVDLFVEGQEIVAEAERRIVEEGAHEPLEDVSAWWPGTAQEGRS